MRITTAQRKGLPEWMNAVGVTGQELELRDTHFIDVTGAGIWCRSQEEELASRASEEIIRSAPCNDADGWGCCVICTSSYESRTKEPTPRQKHLGLWGHHRICDEDKLPIGFKEAEWGSYATLETEHGFCFIGVARFPLAYLENYLVRDIGLVARLDVFLSDRADALLEGTARQLGKLDLEEGHLGVAKYLLERGEIPIRYNTWEADAEYSAIWRSS